jgi:hypothetical protein
MSCRAAAGRPAPSEPPALHERGEDTAHGRIALVRPVHAAQARTRARSASTSALRRSRAIVEHAKSACTCTGWQISQASTEGWTDGANVWRDSGGGDALRVLRSALASLGGTRGERCSTEHRVDRLIFQGHMIGLGL